MDVRNVPTQTSSALTPMAKYHIAGFCAHLDQQYATELESLSAELSDVVSELMPKDIGMANHDSVYANRLLDTAVKVGAEVNLFEHSLWPLQSSPFELPIPQHLTGRHFFYIRSAMNHSQLTQKVNLTRRLRRWSTLQINPARLSFGRINRSIRERIYGPTIGLIFTSGQALSAPDIPLKLLFKKASELCNEVFFLNPHAHVLLRLRDTQDDAQLALRFIKEGIEKPFQKRVSVSRQSEHPFQDFAQRCQRLVEVGMPTSASFEAFIHRIPLYRLSEDSCDSLRFSGRPIFTIDTTRSNMRRDVQRLLNRDQSKLVRRQFTYLRQQISLSSK